MPFPKNRKYVLVGVAVLVGLAWPWTERVLPEWTVTVTTTDGKPVSGVPVLQAWQQQTVEADSHTDLRATNDAGEVVFPPRNIKVSAVRLGIGAVAAVLRSAHEASFGPFGHVIIGVDGQRSGCGRLVYRPRHPETERLKSECTVSEGFSIKQL